jgi:hypothetical protein
MEIKKLAVLGGLCGASYQAAAHPGHGDSLWDEIVHTLTAADHLPFILVVGVVSGDRCAALEAPSLGGKTALSASFEPPRPRSLIDNQNAQHGDENAHEYSGCERLIKKYPSHDCRAGWDKIHHAADFGGIAAT